MYRTAYVTTSTDNADIMSAVVAQLEAAQFGGAVPACTLAKLHRITLDVSAECWLAFQRDATVQYDVFHVLPGDAISMNVADAGIPVHTPFALTSKLMILRTDSSSPVTVRFTAEVSV